MNLRGRPKSFNNFDALEKAMEVFWEKGYEGASMCKLLCAMGISRQSLYNTFGNKRDLYIQCLEFYIHNQQQELKGMLTNSDHAKVKLETFVKLVKEHLTSDGAKGCFLSSTMQEMSQEDTEVKRILDQKYKTNNELFCDFFTNALETGEIKSPLSGKELAQLFDTLLLGATGLCKLPGREEQIDSVFQIFMKQLSFSDETVTA